LNNQAEKSAPAGDATSPAAGLADRATAVVASPAKPRTPAREARSAALIAPQPGRVRNQIVAGAGARLPDHQRADSLESKNDRSMEANKSPAMAAPSPAANDARGFTASDRPRQVIGSARETVEVSGANVEVQTAPREEMRMARNEAAPAIEKAKPAAKEEAQLKDQETTTQGNFATAYSTSDRAAVLQKSNKQSKDALAQWSLAQGKLQRSSDAGSTWQIALQIAHPLLSFGARGSDVWAGGQAGTLFHSMDSGATWTMVQPATKTESLTSDIIAIEIRSGSEIVILTKNNESWTTLDGGKTWDKK
jgi:hypothetical protein